MDALSTMCIISQQVFCSSDDTGAGKSVLYRNCPIEKYQANRVTEKQDGDQTACNTPVDYEVDDADAFLKMKSVTLDKPRSLLKQQLSSKKIPENNDSILVSLLPTKCKKTVESQKDKALMLSMSGQILTPIQAPLPQKKDEFFDCPEPADEFFDCPELTEEQWRMVQESNELVKNPKPAKLNVNTLIPIEDLDERVWSGLCRLVSPFRSNGQKARQLAKKVVSEEKLNELEGMIKDALKGYVQYEVNDNLGRRILQMMLAVGVTSSAMPALGLQGLTISDASIMHLMLKLWRVKDFRDEFNALYYEKNVMPVAAEVAFILCSTAFWLLTSAVTG